MTTTHQAAHVADNYWPLAERLCAELKKVADYDEADPSVGVLADCWHVSTNDLIRIIAALTAAIELMKQQGEDIDDGGPYNGIDWRAIAHELLSRLETASPPNVLVQQLSILGDMAALLRCMFPAAPTEASR